MSEAIVKTAFDNLIGKRVTFFCAVYIYTGKLIEVNEVGYVLEDPAIVYETGAFSDKHWKDAQKLTSSIWTVDKQMVESFGLMKE